MKKIVHQQLNLPADVPVMVLPNALLFPNSLLPLYIFEKRYREMLRHCLERNRMFCVALMRQGVTEAVSDDEFYHVAGLGIIRACVTNTDGTSQLMLQGIARVRFTNFIQHEPYRVAQISELRSIPGKTVEAEALSRKVLELCRSSNGAQSNEEIQEVFEKQLSRARDPEMISDFVAQTFVQDPFHRQEILEELSVCDRLRMLITSLLNQG